jgi:subtilase family serine protease
MSRFRTIAAVATAAISVGAIMIACAPAATASGFSGRALKVTASCSTAKPGYAACFALEVSGSDQLTAFTGPAGYHPADLAAAYKLDTTMGTGQTIAIVDAFDDPNAEADLGVYRSTFALPACTTANGCFKKVNQDGAASPLPAGDTHWGQEISLDLDMASAICPDCHILLVEAKTASFKNLGTAENRAATMGATEISNSYGGKEGSDFSADYNHPGIPITVSSGDKGYQAGPQSPADFSTVTAVGGTSLRKAAGARGWKETVWSDAGSGCSKTIAKPAWQAYPLCKKRMIADVAAVADPQTGVTVYDTYGGGGFAVFGGTSASAPIIAGVYALAGNGASIDDASFAYAHASQLFDVTSGSNGSCGTKYLCTGKKGYDGPTGLGTPNGTGAF